MKTKKLFVFILIFLLLGFTGCNDKPDYSEEPETSNQIASRGKYTKGERLLAQATFTESPKLFSAGIEALVQSLVNDPNFSKANAQMAIAICELSRMRGFVSQEVMGIQITLQNALVYANAATRCNPESPISWSALAIVSIRLSDFETAKAALKSAKKYGKTNWLYLIANGDFLFNFPYENSNKRAKNRSKAVASYKGSITYKENYGLAYTRLLDVYESLDDADGVLEIALLVKNLGHSLPNVRAARYRAAGVVLP